MVVNYLWTWTKKLWFDTSDFGHFNAELVNKLARDKFVHWTVITYLWASTIEEAISGWTKCNFKFQLFHNAYDKAVYSLVIKNHGTFETIPQAYPTPQKKIMVLDGNDILSIGKFVDPNDIHEIKRISHKRSS